MVTFNFLFMTVTVSWNKKDHAERITDEKRIAHIMEEIKDKRAEHQHLI